MESGVRASDVGASRGKKNICESSSGQGSARKARRVSSHLNWAASRWNFIPTRTTRCSPLQGLYQEVIRERVERGRPLQ